MFNEDDDDAPEIKSSRFTEVIALIFVTVVMIFLFVKIVFY